MIQRSSTRCASCEHSGSRSRWPFTRISQYRVSGGKGASPHVHPGQVLASLRNCAGGVLTEAEEALLGKWEGNTAEEALLDICRVGGGQKLPPERLESALLAVEQASLRNPEENIQVALDGTWILFFATRGPIKYVPVMEYGEISMKNTTMDIITELGILKVTAFGIFSWEVDKNLMTLQFSKVNAKFLGLSFSFGVQIPERCFTFFHVDSNVACFRSGNDGVILMVHV